MKKCFCALMVVSSFLLASFIPCAAAERGFDDKEIRIAQFGPQTGPAAPWGAVARGSAFLFDLVNEEGGIHGRKIKYFLRDDQYNPELTEKIVKDLVENHGIFAFTGGVTGRSNKVKTYLADNRILWVVPGTAAMNTVGDREGGIPCPYRFCSYPLFQDEASIVTRYAVKKLGHKKIAVFHQNDHFGKEGLEGCQKRLETYGLKVVATVPVEPTEKDLSQKMQILKDSGAESVLMWVNPTLAVIALKTCQAMQYKPQWIAFDGLSDYRLMHHISGGLFEGTITAAFTPPPDSNDPLITRYREAAARLASKGVDAWGMKETFSTYFLAGIIFAEPLVDALKKVGPNLSTKAVINELNKFNNWKGVGAPITWTSTCHQGTDSVQIQKCGPGGSYILLQDWTSNDLATWKTY